MQPPYQNQNKIGFKTVEVDQQLWYEFYPGMIIPVYAVGLSDILVPSKGLALSMGLRFHDNGYPYCIWASRDKEQNPVYTATAIGELIDGWPPMIMIELTHDQLQECSWVSQEIWIDEHIGHELSIGHDLYMSLSDAYNRCLYRAPRRIRNRANKKLQTWRQRCVNFINFTHIRAGHMPMCPPALIIAKPVYVKR